MRFPVSVRGFLLTSVAATSLLFSVSFPAHDVLAQKGSFMSPSTQWAVSKVQGNTGYSDGYCAVARRFDGNAIMTLARNQAAETSFALDFQTSKFSVGQDVDVVLDPGAGEQRIQKIRPSSGQAFVAKLGRDEAFLDAIERTGMLRVEVSGQSYVFNISDIDAGQIKLNSCLASMNGSVERTPQSSATTYQGNAQYDSEIAALRREVEALKAQNRSLEESSRAAAIPRVVPPAHNEVSVQGQANLQNTRELSAKIQLLEEQNRALRAQINQKEADAYRATKAVQTQGSQQISSLEAENARLKSALQSAQNVQSNMNVLQAENSRLQQELAGALSGQKNTQVLAQQVSSLEEKNASLADALRVAQSGVKRVEGYEITRLESENKRLTTLLEQNRSDHNNLRRQLAQIQVENDTLKRSTQDQAEYQAAVAELKDTISGLRAENLQKAKELSEAQGLLADIESLKMKNKVLTDQLADGTVNQETLDNLQLYATTLEKDKAALQHKNEELEQVLGGHAQMRDELASLKAELSRYEKENKRMASEKEALNATLAKLETQKSQDEASGVAYESQISELRHENERLQDVIAQAKDELKTLELAKAESGKAGDEALVSLQEENVKLRSDLDDALGRMANLDQQVSDKTALLAELDRKNDALEDQLAATMQAMASIQPAAGEEDGDMAPQEEVVAEVEEDVIEDKSVIVAEAEEEADAVGADVEDAEVTGDIQDKAIEPVIAESVSPVEAIEVDEPEAAQQVDVPFPENGDPIREMVAKAARAPQVTAKDNAAEEVEGEELSTEELAEEEDVITVEVDRPESDDQPVVEAIAEVEDVQDADDVQEAEVVEEEADNAREDIVPSQGSVASTDDFMNKEMSQAQIYEEQMRRSLEHQQMVEQEEPSENAADIEADEPDVIEEVAEQQEEEPVEMRMSQDPFEDMKVQEDGNDIASADDVEDEQDNVNASAGGVRSVPVGYAEDKAQAMQMSSSQAGFKVDSREVSSILEAAHVVSAGDIRSVDQSVSGGLTAYQWTSDSVFGSSEQEGMSDPAEFDNHVKNYLEKTQQRCPGDFAIVPTDSKENGDLRVDSYEVACVGNGVNSAASLVFYNNGGTFTAVAHEVPAEDMDKAMKVRDRIFAALMQSSST